MRRPRLYSVKMRASSDGHHISGAESMCAWHQVRRVAEKYFERALSHPKGFPSEVNIKVNPVLREPVRVRALQVTTVNASSHRMARQFIREALIGLGISRLAVRKALGIAFSETVMRGAAVMTALSGRRLDPDRKRGIRATELGITGRALLTLTRRLESVHLNTDTVKEALMVATKIASFGDVVAELCVSDDPDYTTGYIASHRTGYVRVPHMKLKGQRCGGRVIFVREETDVAGMSDFLEKTPVLLSSVSKVSGGISVDEFSCRSAR